MRLKKSSAKLSRNSPCPCGSGLKYKKCCYGKSSANPAETAAQYVRKHKIRLKGPTDIEGIRKAGRLAVATLELVAGFIQPGITTESINSLVHEFTIKHGAIPGTLNYLGYPKSACVSVNEVICHGIADSRILLPGDIVNVDVTPKLDGYFADANQTFFVGEPNVAARKIVSVCKRCLQAGMDAVKPGNTLGDIGWTIQRLAESEGCSVVREFVGHGVGFEFHEPPQIMHYGKRGHGLRLVPGMVFTIEPMINLGRKELIILEDGWTAVTRDGALSAQFEQTILVTPAGFESLTPFAL